MLVTIVICFELYFDTRHFAFRYLSTSRMFLSLDLLPEYRIQHTIGLLYVTSIYSTKIFYRGVSGFATDCPCGVCCRGLTTCLLYVGPLFVYLLLNNSWAVGLTYWLVNSHYYFFLYFDIYNCICLNTSYYFLAVPSISNIVPFFIKCPCTKTFHRRSFYAFYDIANPLLEDSTGDWFEVSPNRQSLLYCKMDQMHLLQACIFAICF